ncbi:MAG: hypothetical protein V3S01_03310 [Dehalococcoidia bacterium]
MSGGQGSTWGKKGRSLLSLEEAWGTIAWALVARKLNIKATHAAGRQRLANRHEFSGVEASNE